jgi:hypothetical protein
LQNFYAVFHTLCELANATVGQFFVSEEQWYNYVYIILA